MAGRAFSACGIPCYGAAARGLEGCSGRPWLVSLCRRLLHAAPVQGH